MNVRDNHSEKERLMFGLENKVALVTGGAGGLGKMFAEVLAEFGADVAVSDIDEETVHETAQSLERIGRRSLAIKADVSHSEDVQHMVNQTIAKLGTIDILVNNAGITTKAAKVADMPIEDWDRVIAVDLRGVFLCTKAALPIMVKQGSGNIINNASIYGVRPLFGMCEANPNANYAAAKAGVISLTKETALEYARDGIRVNCIAPGFTGGTNLALWIRAKGEEERLKRFEEAIVKTTPMGRRGNMEELKAMFLYLASDASSFVTGQVFISDGGICV